MQREQHQTASMQMDPAYDISGIMLGNVAQLIAHPANTDAVVFDTDLFHGRILLMHRFPSEDPRIGAYSTHFESSSQHFELQMQFRIKEDLRGRELSLSLETAPPNLGRMTRALFTAIMASVDALNKLSINIPWYWSFGDDVTPASIRVPLRHAYTLVVTDPEGTAPPLGTDLWSFSGLSEGKARTDLKFQVGYTYTMNVWSKFVDWSQYAMVGLPGFPTVRIDDYFGTQPVFLIIGCNDGIPGASTRLEIINEFVHPHRHLACMQGARCPANSSSQDIRDVLLQGAVRSFFGFTCGTIGAIAVLAAVVAEHLDPLVVANLIAACSTVSACLEAASRCTNLTVRLGASLSAVLPDFETSCSSMVVPHVLHSVGDSCAHNSHCTASLVAPAPGVSCFSGCFSSLINCSLPWRPRRQDPHVTARRAKPPERIITRHASDASLGILQTAQLAEPLAGQSADTGQEPWQSCSATAGDIVESEQVQSVCDSEVSPLDKSNPVFSEPIDERQTELEHPGDISEISVVASGWFEDWLPFSAEETSTSNGDHQLDAAPESEQSRGSFAFGQWLFSSAESTDVELEVPREEADEESRGSWFEGWLPDIAAQSANTQEPIDVSLTSDIQECRSSWWFDASVPVSTNGRLDDCSGAADSQTYSDTWLYGWMSQTIEQAPNEEQAHITYAADRESSTRSSWLEAWSSGTSECESCPVERAQVENNTRQYQDFFQVLEQARSSQEQLQMSAAGDTNPCRSKLLPESCLIRSTVQTHIISDILESRPALLDISTRVPNIMPALVPPT